MSTLSVQQIVDLAYAAAIVDGEGYIGATKRVPAKGWPGKSPKYSIRLSVSMTDRAPIVVVAKVAGVPLKMIRPKLLRRFDHHKDQWTLDLESVRAAKLIRAVLPFLRAKKKQAQMALQLFELKKESHGHRTEVLAVYRFKGGPQEGGEYRAFGLSKPYLAKCETLYRKMLRRKRASA